MKIYFDESGQTGCIIPNKNGVLFNGKQRYFVLGGILCKDYADESMMRQRYLSFLSRHGINGEIKGSDMMTRENNELLNDFINTMLDDEHFFICCYDKAFYLATLINCYFYPRQLMYEDPLFYFTQASALTHESIELFLKYCECNAIGTDEASLEFCKYVADFNFQKIAPECNGYLKMAELVLHGGEALDFPLPFGCYVNPNYTNIINMTAMGETILALKVKYNIPSSEIHITHDRIKEFEREFFDTFCVERVDLQFSDSKSEPLLQYADNIASIFRKCCTETIDLFKSGRQWDASKNWFPVLYAEILRKLSYENIKWDMSISDQVLPLCVEEMFDPNYPIAMRNNEFFYRKFLWYKEQILQNIASLNYDVDL